MSIIKLSKVKKRNRCYGASFSDTLLNVLDIRDITNEKIVFTYEDDTQTLVVRMSTNVEGKGSNIRKGNASNLFLSSFSLGEDIVEGEYELSDNFEEGDFTFFEFELKDGE
jgi:hypothetical protein